MEEDKQYDAPEKNMEEDNDFYEIQDDEENIEPEKASRVPETEAPEDGARSVAQQYSRFEEPDDYFDGPDLEDPVKEPKKPTFKPEDPDYYEEESEWEHLKPRRRRRHFWLWFSLFLIILAGGVALWLRYFSPYVEEATEYGYVDNMERRGTIFKTFEGVLIPCANLRDTTRLYNRDFIFTVRDRDDYLILRRAMKSGKPVTVEYNQYHATLPWRGASKIVVTAVDTVNQN